MKAQELRRGNLVLAKGEHSKKFSIVQVNEITEEGINLDEPYEKTETYLFYEGSGEDETIKGIPLTEESLVKLGFEYNEEVTYPWDKIWKNKECMVNMEKGLFYIPKYKKGDQYAVLNLPLHIHSLQNLYYALTVEELEIKN